MSTAGIDNCCAHFRTHLAIPRILHEVAISQAQQNDFGVSRHVITGKWNHESRTRNSNTARSTQICNLKRLVTGLERNYAPGDIFLGTHDAASLDARQLDQIQLAGLILEVKSEEQRTPHLHLVE
jgi:hypothetical protein